jgi:hypothetical protein
MFPFAQNAAFSGSYVENGTTVNLSWTFDVSRTIFYIVKLSTNTTVACGQLKRQ